MDKVIRSGDSGYYFESPAGTRYEIKRRIGSDSVNSVVYKVTRNRKQFVLKLSLVDTTEKRCFFDNKAWVHQKLSKIAKANATVRSRLSVAVDTGIFVDYSIGYLLEPFHAGYEDFENACLRWAAECQADDKECRRRFVQKIRNSFVQIVITLRMLFQRYGFNHNDMHMRNFMVRDSNDDSSVQVKLIDFDWSSFHEGRHALPPSHPQSAMMNRSYFSFFENLRNHMKLDRVKYAEMCKDVKNKACVIKLVKEGTKHYKGKPCNVLHFAIHMFYSYVWFSSGRPSPSVDLAKLCSDFGKKFLNLGRCDVFDTDFDTSRDDVVLARKLLRTHEARSLRALMREYEEDRYMLHPESTAMDVETNAMDIDTTNV
jgi:Ecdysteroid kinase-like family